jgi:predicted ATP-grasp superfamily ATP-dependent carboligase
MDHAIGASSSHGDRPGAAPILIVGASARAAAQSARRGGLEPWTADLFCDRDLLETCSHAVQIESYPHGIERALAAAPPGPWIYTGALENHPDLIDRIAAVRPLFGICGEPVRAVRNALRLADAVRAAGFNAPRCLLSPAGVPTDGSWLFKPLASAGGYNIERYVGHAGRANARESYFQECIEGVPASAVYIGDGDGTTCLGVTRQLIGLPWCGAANGRSGPFRYCGSIGPLNLVGPLVRSFQKLGAVLARTFTLRGLIGLDVIIQADEIWPIELNPRFTASVEILERTLGVSAVRLHVDAFFAQEETEETEKSVAWASAHADEQFASAKAHATKSLLPPFPPIQFGNGVQGKTVLYASEDQIISDVFSSWVEQQNGDRMWPRVADIPAAGSSIRAGQPFVTVFAEGPDERAVLDGLKAIAADAYRNLAVSPG